MKAYIKARTEKLESVVNMEETNLRKRRPTQPLCAWLGQRRCPRSVKLRLTGTRAPGAHWWPDLRTNQTVATLATMSDSEARMVVAACEVERVVGFGEHCYPHSPLLFWQ
jgi:hypothetical protein